MKTEETTKINEAVVKALEALTQNLNQQTKFMEFAMDLFVMAKPMIKKALEDFERETTTYSTSTPNAGN